MHKERESLQEKHLETADVTRVLASERTCWPGKGYKPKYSEI